jgi:hypothetical protein
MDADSINWQRLMTALNYYNAETYRTIDLDWTMDVKTSSITKPIDRKDFFINDRALVASGEQSFIEMMITNQLKQGLYSGITPCFRDEFELDYLHSNYFMKVELIDTLNPNKKGLDSMIDCALKFYSQYLEVRVLEIGDELYDIIDVKNSIELGSYGTRQYKDLKWVFGTGLAEPRLSKVLKLQ